MRLGLLLVRSILRSIEILSRVAITSSEWAWLSRATTLESWIGFELSGRSSSRGFARFVFLERLDLVFSQRGLVSIMVGVERI